MCTLASLGPATCDIFRKDATDCPVPTRFHPFSADKKRGAFLHPLVNQNSVEEPHAIFPVGEIRSHGTRVFPLPRLCRCLAPYTLLGNLTGTEGPFSQILMREGPEGRNTEPSIPLCSPNQMPAQTRDIPIEPGPPGTLHLAVNSVSLNCNRLDKKSYSPCCI